MVLTCGCAHLYVGSKDRTKDAAHVHTEGPQQKVSEALSVTLETLSCSKIEL